MATLAVGGTTVFDGSATQGLTSATTFPNGHILQCQVASKTSKSTTASTSPTSTGLTLSITPSDATNKIFVQALIGTCGQSASLSRTHFRISGGTTQSVGDADTGHEVGATWSPRASDAGWHQGSLCFGFFDAPSSTDAQTYTLEYWANSGTISVNSSYNNDANVGNAITTLTAWEVVQ